jgi:hypothetical protein
MTTKENGVSYFSPTQPMRVVYCAMRWHQGDNASGSEAGPTAAWAGPSKRRAHHICTGTAAGCLQLQFDQPHPAKEQQEAASMGGASMDQRCSLEHTWIFVQKYRFLSNIIYTKKREKPKIIGTRTCMNLASYIQHGSCFVARNQLLSLFFFTYFKLISIK